MKVLLTDQPYTNRNDETLLGALRDLSKHHLKGCPEYQRIWSQWTDAEIFEQLPWLHVGLFKHLDLRTHFEGVSYERTLKSSATSSGISSQIVLDSESSLMQSQSSLAILRNFVGDSVRPLLVLDSAKSLRSRGELSARVAAAMSLKPLSLEIQFLLDDPVDPTSMKWDKLAAMLDRFDDFLVYGFTWILWLSWGKNIPCNIRQKLQGKRIHFVHSGGWKKLEEQKIRQDEFDAALVSGLHPDSRVIDYYGLVEQVGVIYPQCEYGFRHVPVWAQVIVRDPFNLNSLVGEAGQIQLLNTLALGAPYHSVLTEDLGTRFEGVCQCGREGPRFILHGRIPRAELRGCSNV